MNDAIQLRGGAIQDTLGMGVYRAFRVPYRDYSETTTPSAITVSFTRPVSQMPSYGEMHAAVKYGLPIAFGLGLLAGAGAVMLSRRR